MSLNYAQTSAKNQQNKNLDGADHQKKAKGEFMEFLKTLLSEETYKDLTDKIGADLVTQINTKTADFKIDLGKEKFIPKAKFDEAREAEKKYQTLLAERDTQLTELGQKAKGNAELELKLKTLQEENAKQISEYKEQLTKTKQDFVYKSKLNELKDKFKPKDLADLERFLDSGKVKFTESENGFEVSGLEEQISELNTTKPYLFGTDTQAGTGSPAINPSTQGGQAPDVKIGKII
jgi:hypothetical protein